MLRKTNTLIVDFFRSHCRTLSICHAIVDSIFAFLVLADGLLVARADVDRVCALESVGGWIVRITSAIAGWQRYRSGDRIWHRHSYRSGDRSFHYRFRCRIWLLRFNNTSRNCLKMRKPVCYCEMKDSKRVKMDAILIQILRILIIQ